MTHKPLRVLVGSLAPGVLPSTQPAKMPTGTILLDLGPEHPSQAGLIELRLWTQDDVITTARVVVGAMHRGAEKLFEVRDYRQILMLADRHDWQAPFWRARSSPRLRTDDGTRGARTCHLAAYPAGRAHPHPQSLRVPRLRAASGPW